MAEMSSVTTPSPFPSPQSQSQSHGVDADAAAAVAALEEASNHGDDAANTTDSVSGADSGLASPLPLPIPIPTATAASVEAVQQKVVVPSKSKTIKKTTPAVISLKRATKISLHFKSDIDSSSSSRRSDGNAAATDAAAAAGGGANNGTIFDDINTTTCCSGIIHACRSHSHSHFGGESHTFAWIANVNDAKSSSAVVEYLQTLGYKKSSTKFIPYSSHQQWIARYPHAIPIVECDMDGKLRVHAHSSAGASTTTTSTTSHEMRSASDLMNKQSKKRKVANNKKSKSKPSPKLLSNGCLPNMERDELHIMIHQYFTWLHDELVTMETHATGRRLVSNAGVSVPALRSLVSKLEGAFRAVQQHQQQSILKVNDGGSGGSGGGGGEGSSGGVGVMSEDGRRRTSGITVPTNGGGINGVMDYHSNPSLPFLEQALQLELQRKVLDKFALDSSSSALATSDNTAAAAGEGRDESSPDEDENKLQHWRSLDFDTLYQKLVEFKEDTGHASPPMKHIELGRWVAELRSNKKRLRDRGLEFELPKHAEETETENHDDDDDTMMMPVSVDAVSAGETRGETSMHPPSLPSTKPCTTPPNTHLTQSRVQLLDAISFPWTILPARVTWGQRLEELKQFRELEGRFPTNKEGALGNWLKGQRKLYTKNDADFMMNKRPKVGRIGSFECAIYPLITHLRSIDLLSTVGRNWSSTETASILRVELG